MKVAIYTTRNGRPYVLFGTHYDDPGDYRTYHIEDGPHIERWERLLRQMEDDGVSITAKEN